MSDTAEILRLRVLLAFLQLERESCTVMNMSRMLGEEHYAISRTINGLEKEGLVSRTSPRQPVLTEKGIEEAKRYQKRMELTLNHLLYEVVSMESARNDAYRWALSNTDAERNGDTVCFPAECLQFLNIGSGVDQILHGSVCLKMKCSVGLMHMPESTAIFTVLI